MSGYQEERVPFPSPRRLRQELRLPRPPIWLVLGVVIAAVVVLMPAAILMHLRKPTGLPRIQPVQDMAQQPRLGPAAATALFADGRAMRRPVDGTVARGRLEDDDHYYRGYTTASGDPGAGGGIHFFEGFPDRVQLSESLLRRGREMYGVYCISCHGATGAGEGPVNLWAIENQGQNWVAATPLLSDDLRRRPDGYLYNTIRNGTRNMPSFAGQIDTVDRWAIVAYLRTLQEAAADESRSVDSPVTGTEE
jgi:mono/diheme cytochrome c family protein